MAETVANLNGEVVVLAHQADRRRVLAVTDLGDVSVLDFRNAGDAAGSRVDGEAAAWVRSVVDEVTERSAPIDVSAGFVGPWLILAVAWNRIGHGWTVATLALDPGEKSARDLMRTEGYSGGPSRPVGVAGGRFVVVDSSDEGYTTIVNAFALPQFERHEVLRLDDDPDGLRPTLAGRDGLLYDPAAHRLFLVTVDPDNWDGNRILSVPLDADCRPGADGPKTLVCVKVEPYSPRIGGACVNPFTGEVACVMYSSEWEGVVPVARLPERGDLISVADLYVVRPGGNPRRFDVRGALGVNATLYEREADAPNVPDRFRFTFDFGGARSEVTPVVALGPDAYVIGLFGGSLVKLSTATGAQERVYAFDSPITALAPGAEPDSVLVGLATGAVVAVPVAGASP